MLVYLWHQGDLSETFASDWCTLWTVHCTGGCWKKVRYLQWQNAVSWQTKILSLVVAETDVLTRQWWLLVTWLEIMNLTKNTNNGGDGDDDKHDGDLCILVAANEWYKRNNRSIWSLLPWVATGQVASCWHNIIFLPHNKGGLEWRQCAFFLLLRMIHSKHCVQFYGCVRSGNTNSVISHSQNLKGRSESEAISQNFFFEPTIFQMQHERCLKQVKEVVSKKISFFEKPSLTMETVSTVIIV